MSIPIAMGLMAAGTTATQVYGQKSANKTNKRSLEATERSDVRAERLEDARLKDEREARAAELAEIKAAREARDARDQERWKDYLRVNEPFWQAGSGVLRSLYDIAGMGGGSAPAYVQPMSIADLMQLAQLGSTTPTLPSGRVAPYEALMQGR